MTEPIYVHRDPNPTDAERTQVRATAALLQLGGLAGVLLLDDGAGLTIDARGWTPAACERAAMLSEALAAACPPIEARLGLAAWCDRLADAFVTALVRHGEDEVDAARAVIVRAKSRPLH